MPIYKIRGIDVDFPFEAYDCQIVYMEKVIQCLQERSNALLESPTGTGKTLCLLCATLAWRKSLGDFSSEVNDNNDPESGSQMEHQGPRLPTIVYTSRTHSQLKQVIRELKLSNYRPKMTVLGSREQLCIHEDVQALQGRARDKTCHFLCKNRACTYYSRISEEQTKKHYILGNKPFDIEDLVNFGRAKGRCPYYLSRDLHRVADIIFAPYNYLIDPRRRKSLTGISWSETVLIFDEAHNLEGICSDAASFDLPSSYLTACISEAKQCIDLSIKRKSIERSTEKHCDPDQYAILRALLMKLEKHIGEVTIETKELGFTRPGPYIYDFLSELNITLKTASMLISTIEEAVVLLEEASMNAHKKKGTVSRLEGFKDILETIFRDGGKGHAKFYRFHVQEAQQKITDVKGKARTLSWWCFNPGIAMEEFEKLGIRSIILTSGTLSPLNSFASELKLEFPIRLENPHVISPNQVWVGVVPIGPSGRFLNSSFRNRDSLEYKQELGNAIVNFSRIVPDGLLVFFPSYYVMDQCIECWKNMSHANATEQSTIWERICKNKQPVIEPKQSALFAHAIEDFGVKLRKSGAIFFAVCRGKVSEGLDFADHAGRAVVITGMPFAMRMDPKIQLKREYLDQQAHSQKYDSKVLTGEEWYVQQATRAVNQAVGRVIRHRHDYGAIIFCDERFAQQSSQIQMSYWIRPQVKCYSIFGDVIFTLTRFFRDKVTCELMNSKHTETLRTGNVCKVKAKQAQDKTSSEIFNHLADGDVKDDGSMYIISPSLASNEGTVSDELGGIVPANRANLSSSRNQYTIKNSRNLLCSQKRPQAFDGKQKTPLPQQSEVIHLVGNASCKYEPGTNDAIAPCSLKKSKLENTDAGIHGSKNEQFKVGGYMPAPTTSVIQPQNQENHPSASVPSCNADTKGSAFLAQVQDKLTGAEYKEFIGFMRALKTKTMKIVPVIESIAKLFSVPERFCLLQRFKDYVPVKYQPLYEQHLREYEATVGKNYESDPVM